MLVLTIGETHQQLFVSSRGPVPCRGMLEGVPELVSNAANVPIFRSLNVCHDFRGKGLLLGTPCQLLRDCTATARKYVNGNGVQILDEESQRRTQSVASYVGLVDSHSG